MRLVRFGMLSLKCCCLFLGARLPPSLRIAVAGLRLLSSQVFRHGNCFEDCITDLAAVMLRGLVPRVIIVDVLQ